MKPGGGKRLKHPGGRGPHRHQRGRNRRHRFGRPMRELRRRRSRGLRCGRKRRRGSRAICCRAEEFAAGAKRHGWIWRSYLTSLLRRNLILQRQLVTLIFDGF
ncbi:hypothetical protein PVAP13_2KG295504 [Panicum virgatum]|uniref:Uncharacterized protein n=1 Tax=Panicum virgatum TaxID=38727 RepID=A0A8T0WDG4_PANVG|nr:hypothetical protein PVAP13_2KG295504 [Panicum virgatum]